MSSIANLSKQSGRLWPVAAKQNTFLPNPWRSGLAGAALQEQNTFFPNPWRSGPAAFSTSSACAHSKAENEVKAKAKSERVVEFQKKLRAKTPLGKLDEFSRHPFQEKEPLKPWPNSVNPYTGEIGGPAGPEPTRYGDWERKGRVSDF